MRKDMKLVYVSGPYRAGNLEGVLQNIYRAWETARKFWKAGIATLCPHANTCLMGEELAGSGSPDANTFINGDLRMIDGCDAIFMLPGWRNSAGSRKEWRYARAIGLQILYVDVDNAISRLDLTVRSDSHNGPVDLIDEEIMPVNIDTAIVPEEGSADTDDSAPIQTAHQAGYAPLTDGADGPDLDEDDDDLDFPPTEIPVVGTVDDGGKVEFYDPAGIRPTSIDGYIPRLDSKEEIETNAAGGEQSKLDVRCDLFDGGALLALARVLDHGAKKYAPNNWRKISSQSHLNHALRHMLCIVENYEFNDDTGQFEGRHDRHVHAGGEPHMAHAFCRLMMALAMAQSERNVTSI